jgi:hypothetical protein
MSIPQKAHTFLTAIDDMVSNVSPFVRNHNAGFPAVVYSFSSDLFPSSTNEDAGPRLVRWNAMVLARTLEEAETIGESIVTAARSPQTGGCPQRVIGVSREFESAYDGERQGIYIHMTEMEFFA